MAAPGPHLDRVMLLSGPVTHLRCLAFVLISINVAAAEGPS